MLVRPLGFSIGSRWLKRAGLDYWEGVDVQVVDDLEELLRNSSHNFYFFSSKATQSYTDCRFKPDDWLIFGSETTGLPKEWLSQWPERFATIPMVSGVRCLNLATAAGVVVYEAWRQQVFSS